MYQLSQCNNRLLINYYELKYSWNRVINTLKEKKKGQIVIWWSNLQGNFTF